jgi:phage terminase large subunit GpA-like protein
VRFLIPTIDVQKKSWVVHVHGIGVGGDVWIVDMFKIRKSKRLDNDGDPLPADPAAYDEDWHQIVDQVLSRSYPLADGSGRRMAPKLTGSDSGGAAGVTTNAYNFWRYLRHTLPAEDGSEHWKRFQLVKGEPSKSAPRIRLGYPDSQRKDRHAGARGDIPVLFINSTTLKDRVAGMLGRDLEADGVTAKAGGMVHFPIWAEDWLYRQLTAEVRTARQGPEGRPAVALWHPRADPEAPEDGDPAHRHADT